MLELAGNDSLIQEQDTKYGVLNFLEKKVTLFYSAGFYNEVFSIIDKTIDLIPNGEKRIPLQISAEIHILRAIELKTEITNKKELKKRIFPFCSIALEKYNSMLELDPNDSDALKGKKYVQTLL